MLRTSFTFLCLLLFLCTCVFTPSGGSGGLRAQDFSLVGNARTLNDSCFRLTEEANFQVGAIYFPEKVDLRNSFELELSMFFGCRDDDGADGIAFVMLPNATDLGQAGAGLGIKDVSPALAIEFDTWVNRENTGPNATNDPEFDHVALMANGSINHLSPDNLAGPFRAPIELEDCAEHDLRVSWDAPGQEITVFLDERFLFSHSVDLINRVFRGDPCVFYGFSAATGGFNNRQEVCFTFNSFLSELEDYTICETGQTILRAGAGSTYEWTPATGLDNPFAATVTASPDTTTLYTVNIFDECGNPPKQDQSLVEVAGNPTFVSLGPDTLLCDGESVSFDFNVPTATYKWNDPELIGNSVTIAETGLYALTVTKTDTPCVVIDEVFIDYFPDAEFDLGPSDTSLCAGDTLLLFTGTTGIPATLPSGETFDTLRVRGPGRIIATLPDPCGELIDQIDVFYSDCNAFFVPSAFSPNGDGTNDRFFVMDGGDVAFIHSLSVYDRWGNIVYRAEGPESNNPEEAWNGQRNNEAAPPGVYVWVTDMTYRNGKREIRRGSVTLTE